MDRINPLNPLLSRIERFEQAEGRIRHWESARVEWTLRRLKLEAPRRELQSSADFTGYTCDDFNRVVGTFPMYLFAEQLEDEPPIHRDGRAIHPNWFKTFRNLPFVKKYEERFEELYPNHKDRPLAMIFPRKGFAQGLVLHNGNWDLFVPPQASCHLFKGGKKHAMTLAVQPYAGFIDHIHQGLAWRM